MPTAATHTFSGDCLETIYPTAQCPAPMQNVKLADGTYAKGTVLGEVTATPGTFAAYVDAAVDGTGVARAILKYACVVASGQVSQASGGGPFGESRPYAPVYFGGSFRTSELTGFDAAALADLNGHLANGSVSNGVLVF